MRQGQSPAKCPEGFRRCSMCKQIKELASFPANKSKPLGKGSECKECNKIAHRKYYAENKEKVFAQVNNWRRKNPELTKQYTHTWRNRYPDRYATAILNGNHGITPEHYQELLTQQNGCCAICGTDKPQRRSKRLDVDHCHKTFVIRGLLCAACNTGIGLLKDDPAILKKAITYLERFPQPKSPESN